MLLYYNKSFFWLLVERRGSVFYRRQTVTAFLHTLKAYAVHNPCLMATLLGGNHLHLPLFRTESI